MITIQPFHSKPGIHDIQNAVTVSGMTISVASGHFRCSRMDHELKTRQDFVCMSDPNDTVHVRGYLARDERTKNDILVVDEFRNQDPMYRFDTDPDLTLLHRFFSFDMRPNQSELSESEITVHHIVPVEPQSYASRHTPEQVKQRLEERAATRKGAAEEKALYDAWAKATDPVTKLKAYGAWQARINPTI